MDYKNNSNKSGIYQIRNLVNDKIYIGSSFKFGNRKYQHFKLLKINEHPNNKLQNAYNKYGIDNFVFEILELCEIPELIKKEQYYLDYYKPFGINGYNILKIANNSLGFKHSEETKSKISKIQLGKKVSDSVKNLLLKYSVGRKVSIETREKLRQIHLNKKLSQETKNKISKFFSKSVCRYSLEGDLIDCFDSIKQASKLTGIAEMTIINSTKGITKKERHYKWKIKDKELF